MSRARLLLEQNDKQDKDAEGIINPNQPERKDQPSKKHKTTNGSSMEEPKSGYDDKDKNGPQEPEEPKEPKNDT